MKRQNRKFFWRKGIITVYLLIFGGIFLSLFTSLLGIILSQYRLVQQKVAWNEALNIAEAGINYYRWCINNDIEEDCLSQKDYYDSQGNLLGTFSLAANSTNLCGQDIKKDIVATGWTADYPNVKRQVSVLYARTSVAKYSYVLNGNVWVGADHEIRGPYHSNGGVRMDGENQSTIGSSLVDWICTNSFGCCRWVYFGAPYRAYGWDCSLDCPSSCSVNTTGTSLFDGTPVKDECVCPGVFTTTPNANPGLFDFPAPPFNFTGITIDLAQMKAIARTDGIYLPPSNTINPQAKGYHIKFLNNGSFEAWIITGLSSTYAYSLEEDWHYDYFTITNEYFRGTYPIPSACSAIFVEDDIWVEGEVKGKVSLASADLEDVNQDTDAILIGNINYTTSSGSDGLALIAERNILIGPQSPNNMVLRGIFTAQKGRFGRNHYPNNFKNSLEIHGSVISNGRVGTQWTSSGHIISGYTQRESYFDSNLIYNPPSFVPYVEPEFKIIEWNEIR